MPVLSHYEWDSFLLHKTIWTCHLSNNTKVVQDDGLPGAEPASAWARLRLYLAENPGVRIDKMLFRYMDNVIDEMPVNADGYFFRKAHGGIMGGGTQEDFPMYSIGYYDMSTGMVYSKKFKVPECQFMEHDTRPLEEVFDSVILNPVDMSPPTEIG